MSEPSEKAIRLAHQVHAANISIRPRDAARLIDAALDEARKEALADAADATFTLCGGCQGLGAHTRTCEHRDGPTAAILRQAALDIKDLAHGSWDQVTVQNKAWAIRARLLIRAADEAARHHHEEDS